MHHLISKIPNYRSVKNIIFDFGGVICNIDIKRTEKKFKELGIRFFNGSYAVSERDDLFRKFERGMMTAQEFRNILKNYFVYPVSDKEIDDSWNALLLDIPESRIRLLENLVVNYRIFLLSNSNEIHYNKYLSDFQKKFDYPDFEALFEKAYFSFQIHLQKPGIEVFEYVLHESNLQSQETFFIDDSIQHVEGARKAGILAYHLKIMEGEQILDLFES